MKNKYLVISVGIFLSSCVSSVRNKMVKKEGMKNEVKGKAILQEAWVAQGFDKLKTHSTYKVVATDKWKGVMGGIAKMWPEKNSRIELKYDIGSFDGQVSFLDGKYAGTSRGLQSWNYYETDNSTTTFPKKGNAKTIFGVSALQYLFELGDRLKDAPLITYAGEKEFKGESYQLVFVTWEKLKAHKKHDQYMVWVNKKSKLIEYCKFTIHDPFLPGGAMLPGSIEFTDFKNVDGFLVPYAQYVYLGGPKKKHSKNLHKVTIEDFSFDSFNEKVLYPNPEIKKMGDSK